jgi:sigma-B regulation protein RsbU (phosphoserine phosphatase)
MQSLVELVRHFQWSDIDIAHVSLVIVVIAFLFLLAAYRRKVHVLRRTRQRIQATNDCVLGLMNKASESLKDNLDLRSFIQQFTDYTARSVRAQSAAFFRYDRETRSVIGDAIIGVFPSLINAPQALMTTLVASPQKMQEYLHANRFALGETPFVEAVTQQRPLLFDDVAVRERLRYKVCDCWGMLVVPLIAEKSVYGVLALANRVDRAAFTLEDLHLAEQLSEMAGVTVSHFIMFTQLHEQQQVESQLRTAEVILNHLLPQRIPQPPHFSIAVHYQPAYRLGGDYYDFIEVDDQHLGILVADVSGKGIPAGLVMATTRSLMAVLAARQLSPSAVLCALNEQLIKLIPAEMFVSANYGVLNTHTGAFVFARAGHEPVMCCAPHRAPAVLGQGAGMVIGMLDTETFARALRDECYQLQTGEMLALYTDGLTEAHNAAGEEFSRTHVSQVLMNVCGMTAPDAMQCIVHRVKKFTGAAPIYDDMTIVLVKAE